MQIVLFLLLFNIIMMVLIEKAFFGYAKYSSVANLLLELKLPSFNTVLHR